jgi:hypothetical protein
LPQFPLAPLPPAPASDPFFDRIAVGVLTVEGFLCAVVSALYLPAYLFGYPAPLAIVLAAAVNVLLVIGVGRVSDSRRTPLLPVAAWLVGFLVCMAGGPGGDVVLLATPWTLLLLLAGLAAPLICLWVQGLPKTASQGAARKS